MITLIIATTIKVFLVVINLFGAYFLVKKEMPKLAMFSSFVAGVSFMNLLMFLIETAFK